MHFQLLDCTFRDGGYYNNWEYPLSLAKKYINAVSKLGIFGEGLIHSESMNLVLHQK